MDFSIEKWIKQYTAAVREAFGDRIWFIGLQGSWGREEATFCSDIDMVLILDAVTYRDLQEYRQLLETLPFCEKICGFVSGRKELQRWEKSDLFWLCNDTVPIAGSLEDLLQKIERSHVLQAVKTGVCSVYHGCMHNAVHERSVSVLHSLYKTAAFAMRGFVFLDNGIFIKKQKDLLCYLAPEDREIITWRQQGKIAADLFDTSSAMLLQWASRWIQKDKK